VDQKPCELLPSHLLYLIDSTDLNIPLQLQKRHLLTGKSRCLANPGVPLQLADEKLRIYWV
jgi:hypothetical protein